MRIYFVLKAQPINVVVTGAAGQIAYSLLYQISAGLIFGKDQRINLRMLDIPQMMNVLKGVVMELEDLALSYIDGNIINTCNFIMSQFTYIFT